MAWNYNVYSLRAGTEFQSFGQQKRVMQADARDFLRKPADEVALAARKGGIAAVSPAREGLLPAQGSWGRCSGS
jgi:hypothetical protein